jgi:hypothetical protein
MVQLNMPLNLPASRIKTPRLLLQQDWPAVLRRAYLPEHLPGLMTSIPGTEAWLLGGYLSYTKASRAVFIGYPLNGPFVPTACQRALEVLIAANGPETIWYIGPELPPEFWPATCLGESQSDQYFTLELENVLVKGALLRVIRQAGERLVLRTTRDFTEEHESLVGEFMERQALPPLVSELYRSMPAYVEANPTARVLEARDRAGCLTAVFVVELAAGGFDACVLGCYSRRVYVPYASDLLFYEMIVQARQRGKKTINLGLGVNDGIRRFKTKWGARPMVPYEFCEYRLLSQA